ncbi:35216_t:CDS:2, partial [Racocetra persica]
TTLMPNIQLRRISEAEYGKAVGLGFKYITLLLMSVILSGLFGSKLNVKVSSGTSVNKETEPLLEQVFLAKPKSKIIPYIKRGNSLNAEKVVKIVVLKAETKKVSLRIEVIFVEILKPKPRK